MGLVPPDNPMFSEPWRLFSPIRADKAKVEVETEEDRQRVVDDSVKDKAGG
jgi:hypothetical protein